MLVNESLKMRIRKADGKRNETARKETKRRREGIHGEESTREEECEISREGGSGRKDIWRR